jgi:hypothetical protein
VPVVLPHIDKLSISHLKLNELSSDTSQAQDLPLTPRAVLRNFYIPETSTNTSKSGQRIVLDPAFSSTLYIKLFSFAFNHLVKQCKNKN